MVGLGIELVEVSLYDTLLTSSDASELERHFTHGELEYCRTKRQGGEHLAARQAAKVAALKALGLMDMEQRRFLEVVRASGGQPSLLATGPLLELLAAEHIDRLHLSMSHSGGYAVAMVVAERRSRTQLEEAP